MLALSRIAGALRSPTWARAVVLAERNHVRSMSSSDREFTTELLEDEFKGIAVFAMNRKETRNAISTNFINKLEEAIQTVRDNRDVRVVILKSDVPGTFCAGADLKERAKIQESDVGRLIGRARRVAREFGELPMPVIAAMDGVALGGGLEIALTADIRVASENAKMGLVETRLAIIPGIGGTQRLPRLVGIGKAKQMIFTAKVITGQEAVDIGLVEELVTQNDDGNAAFMKALEMAKEIKDKGPIAVAMAKHAINYGMQTDLNTALKIDEACYAQVIPTKDRVEALNAFREKRAAVFKGE